MIKLNRKWMMSMSAMALAITLSSCSNDSDESKHPQEKADQAKDRQRSNARTNAGNRDGETREQTGNFGLRKASTTTVDYFA